MKSMKPASDVSRLSPEMPGSVTTLFYGEPDAFRATEAKEG